MLSAADGSGPVDQSRRTARRTVLSVGRSHYPGSFLIGVYSVGAPLHVAGVGRRARGRAGGSVRHRLRAVRGPIPSNDFASVVLFVCGAW
jgi:hypothetical protein